MAKNLLLFYGKICCKYNKPLILYLNKCHFSRIAYEELLRL